MKTVKSSKESKDGRLRRRIGKQLSIDRIYDHLQGVILCVDQFGYWAGLSMACLRLMSVLLSAAHSGGKGIV
jgi:hypothetical protein